MFFKNPIVFNYSKILMNSGFLFLLAHNVGVPAVVATLNFNRISKLNPYLKVE